MRKRLAAPSPTLVGGEAGEVKKRAWFQVMRADQIEKREMEWLWFRYLPRGTITLLTGDPAAGKSTLILDIVARLSRGDPLPEEDPLTHTRPPLKSWIMSSEDAADTIILWRLENQGARMENVFITDQRQPMTGPGLRHFEETIVREGIALAVVDTVTTWMGGDIDMNKGNEVMGWLNPLKEIAQRTGCTVVLIRHRRKGGPSDNKLYSGMGSIGFTAAVRSELSAWESKSGLKLLSRTKGNIGAPPPVLSYVIASHPTETNIHGVLRWEGSFKEDPDSPAVSVSKKPKKVAQAQEWLKRFLADGPKMAKECFEEADKAGFKGATLKRAKLGLIKSYNDGLGSWWWTLSSEPSTEVDGDGEEYIVCKE